MPLNNTLNAYGTASKFFHWLTALLILTIIPVGIWASNIADAIQDPAIATTDAMVSRATYLFSLHKTLGVSIFFVALARIIWAFGQVKPGLLNGDNLPEALAAETVHWLLYGSLVAVPLSGWVHHAAATGFAPIWWPFGQSLPFVPKDVYLSEFAGALHYILQWVLIGSIALHVLGALKHHVVDKDATLRRMLPGRVTGEPTTIQPGHTLPFLAALSAWAVAIGAGVWLGWFPIAHTPSAQTAMSETTTQQAPVAGGENQWQIQDGTLTIAITQLGSGVEGGFSDWSAKISYEDVPDAEGRHGDVTVTIATGSLSLGTVRDQALGPDFLNADAFPTALFQADLISTNGSLAAIGTLTIRDTSLPLSIPVTLTINGTTATASGATTVDRRDFAIGQSVGDAGSLGFEVDIRFDLIAERQ